MNPKFKPNRETRLIQSQKHTESSRWKTDQAEDKDRTKGDAKIRKDLSKEGRKQETMKGRFSILLVCFVNVPADFLFFSSDTECISDCIPLYLSLSFTLFLSLSILKAFLPISRSPFFSVLSLSVSLFNSSGSQSRADVMLGEQNRTRCQWNWATALLVPFRFPSLSF